jgi:tetratricopeptide (TPR) repeat protein
VRGLCLSPSAHPIELLLAMLLRSTIVIALCAAATAGAQQRFTTQVMIVPAFRSSDRGLGGRAADIIRGRVAGAFSKNELRVVSNGDIDDWLRRSGFEENVALSEGELRELAKKFRADERIVGTVTRAAGKIRIDAALSLIRDARLAQPLTGEAASVGDAADQVAKEAIAARAQLVPLRQCENFAREGKTNEAAAAATAGVNAFARAVPARVCLLNALAKLGAKPESIMTVAKAVLVSAPANPAALEALATAYDAVDKPTDGAPIWVRLLATDSANEDLIDKVVTALSREGNAKIAQPLIDAGSDLHADNLMLLKLRWLVHLAAKDWKGAISSGERLLARDPATQGDPEFYGRLANAYRSDSQPTRGLSTIAAGVSRFPENAPLYISYLQMLHAESDVALTRGLASFPENPELHVLAAQNLKTTGNAAGALAETKRALAANPKLPHGFLQLAQLQIEVGQIDSAFVSTQQAGKYGEDSSTVAQFALARGNALYKTATGTQKREDYQTAMKFLALAELIRPSPQAKFLIGASALSVSQSAATEAPTTKSCDLSKLADSSLTEAEINLVSGGSVAPDAAKTYLDYVAKLRPYIADQLKTFCGAN